MAAGFEVFNQSGQGYQIDGKNISMVLTRHIRVPTTVSRFSNTALGDGPDKFSSFGTAAVAPGELVAIRSNSPCCIVSVSSAVNEVTFITRTDVGTMVDLYFFAPLTGSTARAGVQVFREFDGAMVFCASKRPLSIVGVLTSETALAYAPGRMYAVIPCRIILNSNEDFSDGSGSAEMGLYSEYMSLAHISEEHVNVAVYPVYVEFRIPDGDYRVVYITPFSSQFIVIDVTGY